MLVAAAIVPAPPILVPAVASGASSELDELRGAIQHALQYILATKPDLLVCVGLGADERAFSAGATGSFRGLGVDLEVELGSSAPTMQRTSPAADVPLSLAVLAWLLGTVEWTGTVVGQAVSAQCSSARASEVGAKLARTRDRVAFVVAGDGSAALTARSPGYLVAGASEWQSEVTEALMRVDAEWLKALSVGEGDQYHAAGRAPWQVAAGAAVDSGAKWSGQVWFDEAPYGVSYPVVTWLREGK